MTKKAHEKILQGLQEARDVVQGVVPAPRIHINGFTYVSLDYHEAECRKAEFAILDKGTNYLAARGYAQGADALKKMKSEIAPDGTEVCPLSFYG